MTYEEALQLEKGTELEIVDEEMIDKSTRFKSRLKSGTITFIEAYRETGNCFIRADTTKTDVTMSTTTLFPRRFRVKNNPINKISKNYAI